MIIENRGGQAMANRLPQRKPLSLFLELQLVGMFCCWSLVVLIWLWDWKNLQVIQFKHWMATKTKSTIIDMPDESDMIAEAMKEAKWAVDNIKVQFKMSQHIKNKFDEKYGPNWHCVVGKNFSSYVSYESKHYIFFYEGALAFLIYKIG